jgi:hypothetical protein
MTLIALGTVVGALALSKPKKRRKVSPRVDVDIDDTDIVVEEVPAPADGKVELHGYQGAKSLGGEFVDWWVSELDGKYGWQYASQNDGAGEVSYLDGEIYHYPSAEAAFDDLMRVLG